MSLKHALLGVIAARPMNGYSLARYFEDSQNKVWAAPQSQVYGTLNKLAEKDLIDVRLDIGRNGLSTKIYSLTKTGMNELATWTGTSHRCAPIRDSFALQALYFDGIPVEQATAVLSDYIEVQSRLVEEWRRHRDALACKDTPLLRERLKTRPVNEHDRIARLKAHVFKGQIRQAEVRIEWAEEMLELIVSP